MFGGSFVGLLERFFGWVASGPMRLPLSERVDLRVAAVTRIALSDISERAIRGKSGAGGNALCGACPSVYSRTQRMEWPSARLAVFNMQEPFSMRRLRTCVFEVDASSVGSEAK